ncbi:NADH:ubiquinone reductase (Na(+)-transporting) subunit C [Chlamydiifrater phoenicopteri]|uniref:NADH:ubiquinone reductase (Na(+)-transporting) subunit C n=1 Tax=Chlamydiifrater phoenicopteri TaxID=2681469 RepID=UPI001BCEB406|nr:NADH:ubiquinone reductase (Na(+)-transporting) subunit C [Chlamydiifrater phoenicopteri]
MRKISVNSTKYTVIFILSVSLFSGILLSFLNLALTPYKERAILFDRNKQMLMSVKVLDSKSRFQIAENNGSFTPAIYNKKSMLLEKVKNHASPVSPVTLEDFSTKFVRPFFADRSGKIFSPEEKGINVTKYEREFADSHLFLQPLLLFYAVLKNSPKIGVMSDQQIVEDPSVIASLIIPVSGFGLWGPIYGFLGVLNDGNTVLGTTWYKHGETPGLGANIANPSWQEQFFGKKIFQTISPEITDLEKVPMGLEVVKGSAKAIYGTSPKFLSAVDGISGATLTCNGVTEAFERSLLPYRGLLLFFNHLNNAKGTTKNGKS